MKRIFVVAALALSATLLAGCSSAEPVENSKPKPTPVFTAAPSDPVAQNVDPAGWTASSIEEFAATFPELDVTALAGIEAVNVQRNDKTWSLGNAISGFREFDSWAESVTDITKGEVFYEGTVTAGDRTVSIDYTKSGEGFIATITSDK